MLPDLEAFRARGRVLSILGRDIFAVDVPPRSPNGDATPILVLHGFPSSSFDYRLALPLLSEHRRVILHDHLGFGFSEKPAKYSYSLFEQADVALLVWRALGVTRGHVIAHDYGTSVATELVARHVRGLLPIDLASLTLTNGSVHIELARLQPGQILLRNKLLGPTFARLTSYATFRLQLRRILADPDRLPEDELRAMWEGIVANEGRERLAPISSYLDERVRFHGRWIGALERLDRPVHVLWGRKDPIAVVAIAEALAREIRGAKLTWLDALGHYPMIEDHETWSKAALSFIEK